MKLYYISKEITNQLSSAFGISNPAAMLILLQRRCLSILSDRTVVYVIRSTKVLALLRSTALNVASIPALPNSDHPDKSQKSHRVLAESRECDIFILQQVFHVENRSAVSLTLRAGKRGALCGYEGVNGVYGPRKDDWNDNCVEHGRSRWSSGTSTTELANLPRSRLDTVDLLHMANGHAILVPHRRI